MARKLPRPLDRRDVLYGPDTPAEQLVQLAEAYCEAGLVFDALEFYARAKDRAGLGRMREAALAQGDAFLLRKVQESMPELVASEDWRMLADRARQLGKDVYAERAEGGGTPPPPPLQEEAKISEEAGEQVADGDQAGGQGGDGTPTPGQHGGTRKREIQGG